MNLKRILAMTLCLCLMLACVPVVGVPVQATTEKQYVTIEAENTEYAVWNRYTKVESNAMYSGGAAAAGAPSGIYPYWDNASDSTEDLSANFLDKSNTPYVAYYVEAPADGTYSIKMSAQILPSSSADKRFGDTGLYYGAFYVNGKSYAALYANSSDYYANVKGKNLTTLETQVELVKGMNTIICVGITEEQDYNSSDSCWSNIDCLMVEDSLTPVKAQETIIYAGDAPYVYGYTTVNPGSNVGDGGWGDNTIPISNMSTSNVEKLRSFTYTVSAPQTGYYDITAEYDGAGNGSDTRAIGLLIDGVPYAYEFKHLDNTNTSGGRVNLGVYLTVGDHVLTFTAPAKRTAEDDCGTGDASTTKNVSWFNYNEIYLYGGLTKSEQQAVPQCYKLIEAENQDYTNWSSYASSNQDSDSYSGGYGVGGATASYMSWEDLSAGKLIMEDKFCTNSSFTPYVSFYVDAPEDGEYWVKMQAQVNIDEAYTGEQYGVIIANNKAYQAVYNGVSGTGTWLAETMNDYATGQQLKVSLKKGVNVIYAIALIADEAGWSNMDYLKIDPRLTYIPEPVDVTDVTPIRGVTNLYNDVTDSKAGGGNVDYVTSTKVSVETLSMDNLWQVPFVAYTVEAPHDGYYEIVQHFGSQYAPENGAFGYIVDGQPAKAAYYSANPSKKVNLSTYLTKGTHTLVITLILPEKAADAENFSYGWVDMGKIHLQGGLALSEMQADPLADAIIPIQAEEFGSRSYRYLKDGSGNNTIVGTDNVTGKVGQAVANMVITEGGISKWSAANVQSLVSMQSEGWLDKSMIPYLTYHLNVEKAGTYNVEYVYKPTMNEGFDAADYRMSISVNDRVFTQISDVQAYPGDTDGWYIGTVQVELEKGRNFIRMMSIVGENATSVSDVAHDYLIIDGEGKVAAVDGAMNLYQAGNSSFINRFTTTGNNRLWAKPSVGGVEHLFMTYDALDYTTIKELPYFAYTVEIPDDGYYDMQTYISSGKAQNSGYIVLLVDGVAHKKTAIDHTGNSLIVGVQNLSHYLTEGTHTIAVSAICEPSVSGGWCDMGALVMFGADVELAETQVDPASLMTVPEGLVDGSSYTIENGVLTIGTNVNVLTLKSNFHGTVTIADSEGNVLTDTDTVPDGAIVSYASGTSYTVSVVNALDKNSDGKIDIRDLKIVNEKQLAGEDCSEELASIKAAIYAGGKSYQAASIGADAMLAYCNPVGRPIKVGSALYLEPSASNFTMTGDFAGDVYLTVMHSHGINDENEPGLFVQIDGGEGVYFDLDTFYTKQTLKIASGLEAGEHTIAVSKSVDSKNGGLYIYSASFNGKLTNTAEKTRKIQFVGDSITSGFGVVTKSYDPLGIVTDGVYTDKTYSYYSYANVVADTLDADYYSVSNGGWYFSSSESADIENKSITRIYDEQSMLIELGAYDHSVWQPDVVVINLGTNDATLKDADGNLVVTAEQYMTDVAVMIDQVRAANPNAKIIWAYGAMGDTSNMPEGGLEDWIIAAIESYNADKEAAMQVTYVTLPTYQNGLWSHPNVDGQQAIGEALASEIAALMGWN